MSGERLAHDFSRETLEYHPHIDALGDHGQ